MWKFQLISLIFAAELVAFNPTQAALADQISWVFYYGPFLSNSNAYAHNRWDLLMQNAAFKLNLPTTIYIPGFTQSPSTGEVQMVIRSYLKRKLENFVVLDWSQINGGNYFTNAIPNTVAVGPVLGDDVKDATRIGLNANTLHVVGHSLGGHLAGYIGRQTQISPNAVTLPRITGLDPAGVGFYLPFLVPGTRPLGASDASFVDIIHTDAPFFGQPVSSGVADFYPNGGTSPQPGCPTDPLTFPAGDACSHGRSVVYFNITLLLTNPTFLAVSADSWIDFNLGEVDTSNEVPMGLLCPTTATGDYFLRTSDAYPYALGTAGTE